jgi:hypothetical protein
MLENLPSSGKPNVRVHVLGGTIVCGDWLGSELYFSQKHGVRDRDELKVEPVSGKAQSMLLDVDRELWNYVGNVSVTEAERLRDSSEYDPEMLKRIIKEMRRVIAELTSDQAGVVFPFGTDTGAFLAHAAAEGIPKSLLGDKALVIAASQHHAIPNIPLGHVGSFYTSDTEAVENYTNAIYLAVRQELRGCIGLCCGDFLHAPRGLHKINAACKNPFISRFPNIARNARSGSIEDRWQFNVERNAETRRELQPRDRNVEFLFSPGGVEDMSLTPASNYANLVSAMSGMTNPDGALRSLSLPRRMSAWLKGSVPPSQHKNFCGLVVQAPGSSNLRKAKADLQMISAAAEIGAVAGAPLVIISDPLQTYAGVESPEARYGTSLAGMRKRLDRLSFGEESHVIDGGSLTRTEATMLMSQGVAEANKEGLTGKQIVRYVADFFDRYWHWLESGNERSA